MAEPGGWERRKRATRSALRAATLELGLERGLADVRVEEIAERAGVSTRTFFNYFATKEDAALLDVLAVPDAVLDGLTGPPATLWAQLTAVFGADVAGVGPDLPHLMELQATHPPLQSRQHAQFARFEARLCAAISTCLSAGGLPDEGRPLRASLLSGSCLTAVRAGLQEWARTGAVGSPQDAVEAAFALLAPVGAGLVAARPTEGTPCASP